jgi:hypothetical protein
MISTFISLGGEITGNLEATRLARLEPVGAHVHAERATRSGWLMNLRCPSPYRDGKMPPA